MANIGEATLSKFLDEVNKEFITKISCKRENNIIFRSNLKDSVEVEHWLRKFGEVTKTGWIVNSTVPDPIRNDYQKSWVCQHNKKNKIASNKKCTNCKAFISAKIRKYNRYTRRNDVYQQLEVPLSAVIIVRGCHNHTNQTADGIIFLRPSTKAQQQYCDYSENGMRPSDSLKLHESKIVAASDETCMTPANATVDTTPRLVYHLREKWRRNNIGTVVNPLQKLKGKTSLDIYKNADIEKRRTRLKKGCLPSQNLPVGIFPYFDKVVISNQKITFQRRQPEVLGGVVTVYTTEVKEEPKSLVLKNSVDLAPVLKESASLNSLNSVSQDHGTLYISEPESQWNTRVDDAEDDDSDSSNSCSGYGVMADYLETVLEVEEDNIKYTSLSSSKTKSSDICPIAPKKPRLENGLSIEKNGVNYVCDFEVQSVLQKLSDTTDIQDVAVRQRKEVFNRLTALEKGFRDVDAMYNKIQKQVDKLRVKICRPSQEQVDMIDFVSWDNKGDLRICEPYKILLPRLKPKLSSSSTPSSTSNNTTHTNTISTNNNVAHKPHNVPVVNRVHIPTTTPKPPKTNERLEKFADVIPVGKFQISRPNLPPVGRVKRPELYQGTKVFAVKSSYLGIWLRGRITDIKVTQAGEKLYRVKFENKKAPLNRLYSGKHLAYTEPADVILPVGSRVVAYYREEYSSSTQAALYAGVVAEPPKVMNGYRYLVFFDDGYAQYVQHKEIFLVCNSSAEVWEDIHPDSKDFIRKYLKQYPERPMLKLQRGQVVKTEWNGVWWVGRVVDVDASLVKMFFDADERTEWIYRGSTRLGPLYNELASAEASRLSGKSRRHNLVTKKKNLPYVEYTRGLDEPLHQMQDGYDSDDRPQLAKKHTGGEVVTRNVARKSTTQDRRDYTPQDTRGMVYESQSGNWSETKLPFRSRIKYRPHRCSSKCAEGEEDPSTFKGENPLRIPMLCGWERQILRHRSICKRISVYTAPCGRRLRTLDEVERYLRESKSRLTVDLFCFDSYVHPFKEFVPLRVLSSIKDITYGKETVAVSCVNSLDKDYPPYIEYSNQRYPAKGVNLNLDEEFLCGCDCEDNCENREKCKCQQLTVTATECLPTGRIPDAGYKHRRLYEPLVTGVYECNSHCKCKSNCPNRVVQNGLQLRLQVFKTENKGWGIRAIDDIPQGMFICIYAGQLLTEQLANEGGNQNGDEYLAELDHIEVVERLKEGYESEIDPELDDASKESDEKGGEEEENEESDEETDQECQSSGENAAKGAYTDDSDYDISIKEPVNPKQHLTRSKGNKEKGKQHEEKEEEVTKAETIAEPHSETIDENKDNKTDVLDADELPDTEPNRATPEKYSLKPCPLSPDTLKRIENVSLIRKVRVGQRTSTSDRESISDTEESKSDKNSIQDSSEVESNSGKGVKKSLFSQLPDPMNCTDLVNLNRDKDRKCSTRSFFNEEYCYIMDAKTCGNIGRYLNHSCSPNVFVQNVFVDTHDLRFPWVTFFAMTYVRAGTELTWDYNYEVGSVPGKIMYCNCGSTECRGRLL